MPATNKTTNFELPQFIATDIPTWLDDVNDAMQKIDTALQNIKSTGTTNEADISEIETSLQAINSSLASANGNITTLQNNVTTLTSQVNNLNNQFNMTSYKLTGQIYAYRNDEWRNVTSEFPNLISNAQLNLFANQNFSLFKLLSQINCNVPQNNQNEALAIGFSLPEGFIKNSNTTDQWYGNAIQYKRGDNNGQLYSDSITIAPTKNLLLISIPNIYSSYNGTIYFQPSQNLFINQDFYLEDTTS